MSETTIPAKSTFLGAVGGKSRLIDVELVVNTSAYADGDLLSDVVEIPDVFRGKGLTAILHYVKLVDEDKQDAAIDLCFTTSSATWGTINSTFAGAASITKDMQTRVRIAASDYVAMGANASDAEKDNLGRVLVASASSTSLYVAAISRGTPTYTAADHLTLKLGLLLD